MTDQEDWSDVGDSISGLALKLKLHFEEVATESAAEAKEALDAASDGVEGAFDGLKATIADPAMKQDLCDVAAGLRDAMGNTFAELKAQLNVAQDD